MDAWNWQRAATVLAVLTPLVGVPVTVFTFYLKGLRAQQRSRGAELGERLAILDAGVERLREEISALRRDCALKEDWLRESLWARRQIERMSTALTRAQAQLEGAATAAAVADRAMRAVAQLEQRMVRADAASIGQERQEDGKRT